MDAGESSHRPPSDEVGVPPRVSTLGVPRRDEHKDALIIAFGILVAVLALAATIGYAVYSALTDRDQPTIGLRPVATAPAADPGTASLLGVRTGPW